MGFRKENLPPRPRIIFLGTPEFAVPSLKALVESGHNVRAVVTQPDRPRGRGRKLAPSPVKRFAMERGLEVLQPEKAREEGFCTLVREGSPDLLVVVAFGQILKKSLLDTPGWGALNIHASLLPKYRGAAPIQWAILNNETRTGLTAMHMDEGMDTGPILFQEEIPIGPEDTFGMLQERLGRFSGEFLLRVLKDLSEGRLREIPQDHAKASYAPKIDRGMAMVKWDKSAEEVSGLIRALDPWPGAFTTYKDKQIKLFLSRVIRENRCDLIPGRIKDFSGGSLRVETGEGLVEIKELQAPGKKRLKAVDFSRGFSLETGSILGR